MSVFEFFHSTGFEPTQDDMERANCPDAGKEGHAGCGLCFKHLLPRWTCPECFARMQRIHASWRSA